MEEFVNIPVMSDAYIYHYDKNHQKDSTASIMSEYINDVADAIERGETTGEIFSLAEIKSRMSKIGE